MKPKMAANLTQQECLDTVGVVGSTPIARTISKMLDRHQTIEIPDDCVIVPAIEYIDGRARIYLTLSRCAPHKNVEKRGLFMRRK